ncbi:hypothetical protein, partial [Streptomyces shenzhenensis]|uniref:hypothetical protein n=1 Tax=Streptomyces shenzhenensis TaxID=943815 RepID=UPI001C691982
ATAAVRRYVLWAVLWGVRLREELLLNTDSFCMAAGRTARGDPDGGWAGRAELGGTRNHVRVQYRARQQRWGESVGLL